MNVMYAFVDISQISFEAVGTLPARPIHQQHAPLVDIPCPNYHDQTIIVEHRRSLCHLKRFVQHSCHRRDRLEGSQLLASGAAPLAPPPMM